MEPSDTETCAMCGAPSPHLEAVGGYWVCIACKPEAIQQHYEMLRDLEAHE